MAIPSYTTPFIFWRPSKVYGIHKVCITGKSLVLGKYLKGDMPPNYPVPTVIGEVVYFSNDYAIETVITDCDERADPRLCIVVQKDGGKVFTDEPHDSPNYR